MSTAVNAHPAIGIADNALRAAPVKSPSAARKAASPSAITVPTPGTSLRLLPAAFVAAFLPSFSAISPPLFCVTLSSVSLPSFALPFLS